MWLFKTSSKTLITLLIIAGFSALSACGFRPLYGTSQNPDHIRNSLASISVEEPKDRLHQQLRNHLVYLLSSGETAGTSRYQLMFAVTELETNVLVQRSTQVDRHIYQISIKFDLYDANESISKFPVYTGSDLVKISYTRTASEFNNLRAKKSASEKASIKAAENLHIRLGSWFARKSKN